MFDCGAACRGKGISPLARKTFASSFDVHRRRLARRLRTVYRDARVRRIRAHDGNSLVGPGHHYEIRPRETGMPDSRQHTSGAWRGRIYERASSVDDLGTGHIWTINHF